MKRKNQYNFEIAEKKRFWNRVKIAIVFSFLVPIAGCTAGFLGQCIYHLTH